MECWLVPGCFVRYQGYIKLAILLYSVWQKTLAELLHGAGITTSQVHVDRTLQVDFYSFISNCYAWKFKAKCVKYIYFFFHSGTNTTNVTQTRVTHRPHVHVTPLNVPGMGMNQFDPFLPCQSHHIRPATRRRHQAQTQVNPCPPSLLLNITHMKKLIVHMPQEIPSWLAIGCKSGQCYLQT